MNPAKLAIKNITGSAFRSLAVFLCVMFIALFFTATMLIIEGTERSIGMGLERLGADIVIVPEGAESRVETALLTGTPARVWMPESVLDGVAGVPGVGAVSPQIYLSSLRDAACCQFSEMFLVVFDPATDFTITPWLQQRLGRGLEKGEAIGGSLVYLPSGESTIRIYGYELSLKGNLEATGTGLDQTLFFTIDTAREIAAASVSSAEAPLEITEGSISAAMVRVLPEANRRHVALQVMMDIPGVMPIESPALFGTIRRQMTGLLWSMTVVSGILWTVSAVLIGLVFSMAVNERRRDIAVLRALGARRSFVFGSIIFEAGLLSLGAGLLGIGLGGSGVYLFKELISLGTPFLFPDLPAFTIIAAKGLALALGTVTLGAFMPALRASRQEEAVAMRL